MLMLSLVAVMAIAAGCQSDAGMEFEVVRLSDRVIAISSLTGNSRAMAICSEKGILLVDTFWSRGAAEEARVAIAREFGRDDFAYVVNSSADDLSSRGNSAFPGATIIAHYDCNRSLMKSMETLDADLGRRADEFGERVVRSERQLAEMEPGSEEAISHQNWIDLCRRVEEDMRRGYEIVLPDVTFSDHMSIDLGDVTVELLYFGSTANNGDVFVIVPGEGVAFLGDVFHAAHALPNPRGGIRDLDTARWLESLDYVLESQDEITRFVRANGDRIWAAERLRQHRDLLAGVLSEVESADAAGLGLDETLAGFRPLEDKFPFIRTWPAYERFGDEIIVHDVNSLVTFVWGHTHLSGASRIAEVMEEDGIETAGRAFRAMRASGGSEYYLSEGELNAKGYEFLGREMVPEALAMFKFAVEAYPQSANAYDSLGEAYMRAGETALAIENYRKSIVIDPDNVNAVRMLDELEQM